jgi:beta-glucuronidase
MKHKGGFLPFEAPVDTLVVPGAPMRITVCVDNRLDWASLPPGELFRPDDTMHPKGYTRQEYHFDFFNYSGIHRPVVLYATSHTYIEDITAVTAAQEDYGSIDYTVITRGAARTVSVTVHDEQGRTVASAQGPSGSVHIPHAHLWEPGNAYLYTMSFSLTDTAGHTVDTYDLRTGIRTVSADNDTLYINGKPFYFRGFGMHEDADIRGKGYDDALWIKNFELLRWIGANSLRTSHYPYAEEILHLADEYGIAVIDETPAVGFNFWPQYDTIFCKERINDDTLAHHCDVIEEMIARDKNHPCVLMWSVANESATEEKNALPYYEKVVAHTRAQDPSSRPVTIVECSRPEQDTVAHLFDVICVNRYFGWYTDSGDLSLIEMQLSRDIDEWRTRFNKPLLVTEFGADTIAGYHAVAPRMFTEEFQSAFLSAFCRVLDAKKGVIGEQVWNFADFGTQQDITRVNGNKKGVFTRQREPKMAAHTLRSRWLGAP